MSEKEPSVKTKFVDVSEGPRHSLGIADDGKVYSWGSTRSSNNLGQLGRDTSKNKKKVTRPSPLDPFDDNDLKAEKVFVSNSIQKDSGHSAILDKNGRLWMTGCDRWQQLGLGSVNGGSAGYTWKGGRLWQDKFVLSESITTELEKSQQQQKKIEMGASSDGNSTINNSNHAIATTVPIIRDVALGADHTLVLSSNRIDVFAFGKCGDGQCGFIGKPYISAPRKSKLLSSTSRVENSGSEERNKNDRSSGFISAVCAIESCSITLDDEGKVMEQVGKCTPTSNSASMSSSSILTASALSDGIKKCIQNAKRRGLIINEKK